MTIPKNKHSIKKTFGLTVRMLRYQADMSQEQLAEKAHLHPTYISSVERGKRSVGLEKIISIARALGVSPKDLMPP
jgi:transcriptional regulator with XRE-family HTH domain